MYFPSNFQAGNIMQSGGFAGAPQYAAQLQQQQNQARMGQIQNQYLPSMLNANIFSTEMNPYMQMGQNSAMMLGMPSYRNAFLQGIANVQRNTGVDPNAQYQPITGLDTAENNAYANPQNNALSAILRGIGIPVGAQNANSPNAAAAGQPDQYGHIIGTTIQTPNGPATYVGGDKWKVQKYSA